MKWPFLEIINCLKKNHKTKQLWSQVILNSGWACQHWLVALLQIQGWLGPKPALRFIECYTCIYHPHKCDSSKTLGWKSLVLNLVTGEIPAKESWMLTFNVFLMEHIQFPKVMCTYQSPEICEFREMKLIYECTDHRLTEQMYFFLQAGLCGSLYTHSQNEATVGKICLVLLLASPWERVYKERPYYLTFTPHESVYSEVVKWKHNLPHAQYILIVMKTPRVMTTLS